MMARLAVAGALLSLGHLGATAVAALRLRERDAGRKGMAADTAGDATTDAGRVVRVLLVRPCRGARPELAAALASTAGARTRHRLRVAFAVAHASDPAALPAARAASSLRSRGWDAEVVVTGAVGANGKAAQLAAVLDGSDAEVAIVADDDVDLDGVDLDALVDTVLLPCVGAVWAPPVEVAPRTPADRASAAILGASLHAFVVLHAIDASGMVGKLFAVRSSAAAEAGGFGALRDVLGEDVELARRLRAVGWRVEVAATTARSLAGGRGFAQVVTRYARWIAVVRAQRPHLLLAYPACFLAPMLSLGVAAAAAPFAPAAAVSCGGIALVARAASGALAASRAGRALDAMLSVDVLLGDAVLAAAFVRAIARRGFDWRGRRLVIDAQGCLREEARDAVA